MLRNVGYGYQELFSFDAWEQVISSEMLPPTAVQVYHDGRWLRAPEYVTSDGFIAAEVPETLPGVASADRIRDLFDDHATVVLNLLSNYWAPARELAASLTDFFGRTVIGNAYATPKGSPAFAPHHDSHDVLVFQLEGSKRWRVWSPDVVRPLPASGPYRPEKDDADAAIDVALEPGDVLYLPRGWIHATSTSDSPSLQITFAICSNPWIEAVRSVFEEACDDEVFRGAWPIGFANSPAEFAEKLRELTELGAQRLETVNIDEVAAKIISRSGARS